MYGSVQATDHRRTTQITLSLHLFFQTGHPSKFYYETNGNSIVHFQKDVGMGLLV